MMIASRLIGSTDRRMQPEGWEKNAPLVNRCLQFAILLDSVFTNPAPMKATVILLFCVLVTPLVAQNITIPAETKPSADKVELLSNQKAFLNLPEETRKTFIKHLSEADRVFQQKRIVEALAALDKAAAIFNDSPEIYNLRGSCYMEMRAFDKALAAFLKAADYAKDNPSLAFNIGEVYFVTKQWQKSLESFQKVLKNTPGDNIALVRLIEFKILLCLKKLDQKDEVTILAEKYDFLDDSPFYYYAKAIIAYDKNDRVKAEEWLAIAGRIFKDSKITAPWQDTLVEYGYIKSFYGDDAAADD